MALDVYGLTRRRDAATLNQFVDEYVDRVASANRGDEELILKPLDAQSAGWERVPARSNDHILEVGLSYPRRAFVAYFTALSKHHQTGIERVIVGFTQDNQLALGLSVYGGQSGDSKDDEDYHELRARMVLARIVETYDCHIGLILLESPPPASEREFRHAEAHLPVDFLAIYGE